MSAASPKRFVVFGGGRWAKSIVSVLRSALPEETENAWVSRHCFADVQFWLRQNPVANLTLLPKLNLETTSADAVIVATSPASHFALVQKSVGLGIPTLCEKPIALESNQLAELLAVSQQNKCPLGINLEFQYASYLQEFSSQMRSVGIRSIQLEWRDPWVEDRNGEKKPGEFYTSITHDQLPHCWSILSVLLPDKSGLQVREIEYSPAGVQLGALFGDAQVSIQLSRRASQRVRSVSVLDQTGVTWKLDFSREPGTVLCDEVATQNHWSGDRPLAKSLSSFVQVVQNPDSQSAWPLALTNCLDAVESAIEVTGRLNAILDHSIKQQPPVSAMTVENIEQIQTIVDRFLPEAAERGHRPAAETLSEQLIFAQQWILSHS